MSIKKIRDAFKRITFETDAERELAAFGLERLEDAIENDNAKAQMDWFDKLTRMAKNAPKRDESRRAHRAKAIMARKRAMHGRKGYGKGGNE